jgi:hypothetical protein
MNGIVAGKLEPWNIKQAKKGVCFVSNPENGVIQGEARNLLP